MALGFGAVAVSAVRAVREAGGARRPLSTGWWGMLWLVAGEGTLFGVLLGTYAYLRFRTVTWPPRGVPLPDVGVPVLLLAVLVATSLPIALAAAAAHRDRLASVRAWTSLALVVQAGYLGMQIALFRDDLARFVPEGSAYGSIYYTLLGAHHVHVALGLLLDAWLLVRLATGLTPYRRRAVRAIALYWHVVNALAIAVTLTLLSPAL